jgi:hypothetical protein
MVGEELQSLYNVREEVASPEVKDSHQHWVYFVSV